MKGKEISDASPETLAPCPTIQLPFVSDSLMDTINRGRPGPEMGLKESKSLQEAARRTNFRGLHIEHPSDVHLRQPVSPLLEEHFPNRICLGIFLLPSGTICEVFFTGESFVTTPVDPNYAAERDLKAKAIERIQEYIESSTPSRVQV